MPTAVSFPCRPPHPHPLALLFPCPNETYFRQVTRLIFIELNLERLSILQLFHPARKYLASPHWPISPFFVGQIGESQILHYIEAHFQNGAHASQIAKKMKVRNVDY